MTSKIGDDGSACTNVDQRARRGPKGCELRSLPREDCGIGGDDNTGIDRRRWCRGEFDERDLIGDGEAVRLVDRGPNLRQLVDIRWAPG